MLDNGSMVSIFRQLIIDSLARLTPFPKYQAISKVKKTSARRNKNGRYWPHQGRKEIARRKWQLDRCQLDFTASGQMHIKGNQRLIREAYEESHRQYQLRTADKVKAAN